MVQNNSQNGSNPSAKVNRVGLTLQRKNFRRFLGKVTSSRKAMNSGQNGACNLSSKIGSANRHEEAEASPLRMYRSGSLRQNTAKNDRTCNRGQTHDCG